ncbi:MAG: Crp/Fnr family transcriptional regulator [Clostridiales bacterium]|jgi:CRP-like cAMP-binding protein|nr:Crp/Fnr family transcriptional regulator [Clostridiales bacterium]
MSNFWQERTRYILTTAFSGGYDPRLAERLFASGGAEERQALIRLDKGETFIHQGFDADSVYILLRGAAKVVVFSMEGNSAVVDVVRAPHCFGLPEVLQELPVYSASAQTTTGGLIAKIPSSEYLTAVAEDREAAAVSLRYLAWLAKRNMDKLELKAIAHPRDILARFLHQNCIGKPLPHVIKLTKGQIAEELHINLRTLYRYMTRLADAGLIQIQHGKIVIDQSNYALMSRLCKDDSR